MNSGDRIKQLRLQNNLTLEELGQRVGVGKSTVRKWETGAIANMRRDKIAKLAEALGTTVMDIMGLDDYPVSCSIFKTRFNELFDEAGYTSQSFSDGINAKGILYHGFSVTPSLVEDWKSGAKEPSLDVLVGICDFLGVTPNDILGVLWDIDGKTEMISSEKELSVPLYPDEAKLIEDYRDASVEIREEAAAMLHRSAERRRQDADNTNAG